MLKQSKKRSDKYEGNLFILGSFDEVLKVSVPKEKKESKQKDSKDK